MNWEKSCISTPNSLACIWLLPVRTLPICLLPVMARMNSSSSCPCAFPSFLLEKVRRMQLLMAFLHMPITQSISLQPFVANLEVAVPSQLHRFGTGNPGSLTACQILSKYGLSLLAAEWKCNPYSCTLTVCFTEYFLQFPFNFTLMQALLSPFCLCLETK